MEFDCKIPSEEDIASLKSQFLNKPNAENSPMSFGSMEKSSGLHCRA
jgi:hypothetical protein